MKVKVFYPNREGKIEFTRQELEELLDEVYREGQKDCNCGTNITWTSPYINPYVSTTSNVSTSSNTSTPNTHTITTGLNAADAKEMSKHIDEIIKNATAKIDNDAFSKLAKELNF